MDHFHTLTYNPSFGVKKKLSCIFSVKEKYNVTEYILISCEVLHVQLQFTYILVAVHQAYITHYRGYWVQYFDTHDGEVHHKLYTVVTRAECPGFKLHV